MKQKPVPAKALRLPRTRYIRSQKLRRLDESGPDELLDDWMVSGPAVDPSSDWNYDFFDRFFFGTLAPFFRASESPIAIACFLLLTFLPDLPLLSVPAFRFFMARPTFFAAPLEYFRFFAFLAIVPTL
jgi:hypothetical protein